MVTIVIILVAAGWGYHWKMKKGGKLSAIKSENVKLLRVAASPSPSSPPAPPPPTGEATASPWKAARQQTSFSSLSHPLSSVSQSLHVRSSSVDHGYHSNTVSCESHATLGERSHDSHDIGLGDHVTLFGSSRGDSLSSRRVSHHGHMTPMMTSHGSHMTPTTSFSRTLACHSSANSLRIPSQRRMGPHQPDYHGGHRTRNFTDPPHSYSHMQSTSQAKRCGHGCGAPETTPPPP